MAPVAVPAVGEEDDVGVPMIIGMNRPKEVRIKCPKTKLVKGLL